MKQGKQVKLSITSFSKEGQGVGVITSSEGKPSLVEVPFTMPGDEVIANLLRRRKGMYQSQLEVIEQPSEQRITHALFLQYRPSKDGLNGTLSN